MQQQISVPKEQLASTIGKISNDGGTILRSAISQDRKEVVLIFNDNKQPLPEPPQNTKVSSKELFTEKK